MQDLTHTPAVPDLANAREALAGLATEDAVQHLEAALASLQNLATALHSGHALSVQEKRLVERSLLRLKNELRDAGTLTEQGLAYCQDWALQLQPPPAYLPNGAVCAEVNLRHDFSIDA